MNDYPSEHEINLQDLAAMFALQALITKTKTKLNPQALAIDAYSVAKEFMNTRAATLKEQHGNKAE